MCCRDTAHGPVRLWRLSTNWGTPFLRVCLLWGSQWLSGRQPSQEESFCSALGHTLSHGVYKSVTLALSQEGTHLPEEVWGEEKHQTLAMKTLRARFKKTEVSLRPLRCPLSLNFRLLSPRTWLKVYWAFAPLSCVARHILLATSL